MIPIEQVIEGTNAVDVVNDNFAAIRGSFVGAHNAAGSIDLSFALYGGMWGDLDVPAAIVMLEDDDVNYIVMDITTGEFSASTTAYDWQNGLTFRRCLQVTAAGGGVNPTDIEDVRFTPGGLFNRPLGTGTGSVDADDVNYDNTLSGLSAINAQDAIDQLTRNDVNALGTSGSVTVDLSLGDYFTINLSGNVTSLNFSNLPGSGKGVSIMILITQDSTPRTFAFPASFKWPDGTTPSITTTSGAEDLLALTTFDNGTSWHATLSKDRS